MDRSMIMTDHRKDASVVEWVWDSVFAGLREACVVGLWGRKDVGRALTRRSKPDLTRKTTGSSDQYILRKNSEKIYVVECAQLASTPFHT